MCLSAGCKSKHLSTIYLDLRDCRSKALLKFDYSSYERSSATLLVAICQRVASDAPRTRDCKCLLLGGLWKGRHNYTASEAKLFRATNVSAGI